MATIELRQLPFLPWFSELGRNIVAAHRRQQTYRRTLEELNMLSDRDLADLGIARGNLPQLAREAIRSSDD